MEIRIQLIERSSNSIRYYDANLPQLKTVESAVLYLTSGDGGCDCVRGGWFHGLMTRRECGDKKYRIPEFTTSAGLTVPVDEN